MAYKVLNVNYQEMAKLHTALQEAADRALELAKQMEADVAGLENTWKGPNHDAFVKYFEDRFFWVGAYTTDIDFLKYQAEFVEKAIKLYMVLEADIDAAVKSELAK